MLTKRIIPCLDVKNGLVVKGIKFVDLKDVGDPVEMAAYYAQNGADELVFLDISASIEGRKTMIDVVSRISEQIFIPLTVGGGISEIDDIKNLLRAGADKVSLNTAAVQNPDILSKSAKKFGSQCIVIAIDAKRLPETGDKWEVCTHGGRRSTGIDAVKWAQKAVALGAGEVLLTSMDEDGRQLGYDLALTKAISSAVNVPVIASGGAGSPEHMLSVLKEGNADAVLAASIFHNGTYSIRAIKEYLQKNNIPVRL